MFWSIVTVFFILLFLGLIIYAYVDEYLEKRKKNSFDSHVQDDLDLFK